MIGFVFRLFGVLLLARVRDRRSRSPSARIALAFGLAMLHAALPLIVVVGIVWLIAHHHKTPAAGDAAGCAC